MSFAEIKKSINSNLDVPLDRYWNRGFIREETGYVNIDGTQADKLIDVINITSNNGGFFHGVHWNLGYIGQSTAEFMLTAYIYIDDEMFISYNQKFKNQNRYDQHAPNVYLLPQETIQHIYNGNSQYYRDMAISVSDNFDSAQLLSSPVLNLGTHNGIITSLYTFAKEIPFKKSLKLQLYCNDGNYGVNSLNTRHDVYYYLND